MNSDAISKAFDELWEKNLIYKAVPQKPRFVDLEKWEPLECTLFRTKDFEDSQNELRVKIVKARELISSGEVKLDYELRVNISKICSELNVDGLRGDIVTSRAAKALCAFEGRKEVTQEDIFRIISLTLSHRLRKDPLAQMDNGSKVLEVFTKVFA